jgi:predicted NBD/HSP70 family sugar kinase
MRRAGMTLRFCLFCGAALWLLGPAYAGSRVAEVPALQNPVGAPGLGTGRSGAGAGLGPLGLQPASLVPQGLAAPSPSPQPTRPQDPAAGQTDVQALPVLGPALAAPPAGVQTLTVPGPALAPDSARGPPEQGSSPEAEPGQDLERAAQAGTALFDGAFQPKSVALDEPGIAPDLVLASSFRGQLAKLEALVPQELLETPGPLKALRQDLQSGFAELKAQRELLRAELGRSRPDLPPAEVALLVERQAASDPAYRAVQERVVRAARRLLARYNASLPPGEMLDLSSPEAFAASLGWSSRLHRSGAGAAFPFRFGTAARQAALAVRDALYGQLPQLAKPGFEGVARVIGVLVMRDGTVYVAFSGSPELLRTVMGGFEAGLEARLNASGGRRFRVLPADTPVPEGLERLPDSMGPSADNRFCAEKKLLAVLRQNPALRSEAAQWATLWRGDAEANTHGTRQFPAFMLPCPHCVRNAPVMLGENSGTQYIIPPK